MKALKIPAEGDAIEIEITDDANAQVQVLQDEVGGFFDMVPGAFDSTLVVNDEGLLRKLPFNYVATGLYADTRVAAQMLAGDVLVVGVDHEGELTDYPVELRELAGVNEDER